jgi:hypothetical protein
MEGGDRLDREQIKAVQAVKMAIIDPSPKLQNKINRICNFFTI